MGDPRAVGRCYVPAVTCDGGTAEGFGGAVAPARDYPRDRNVPDPPRVNHEGSGGEQPVRVRTVIYPRAISTEGVVPPEGNNVAKEDVLDEEAQYVHSLSPWAWFVTLIPCEHPTVVMRRREGGDDQDFSRQLSTRRVSVERMQAVTGEFVRTVELRSGGRAEHAWVTAYGDTFDVIHAHLLLPALPKVSPNWLKHCLGPWWNVGVVRYESRRHPKYFVAQRRIAWDYWIGEHHRGRRGGARHRGRRRGGHERKMRRAAGTEAFGMNEGATSPHLAVPRCGDTR